MWHCVDSDSIDNMAGFHTWLSTVVGNPALASWLQAFAAVVALGISVWANLRVGSAERRRDHLQAVGIAVAVYLELLKLKIVVDEIQGGLTKLTDAAENLGGQSSAANVLSRALIPIPPMIDRNIDKLYLPGKTGGLACVQLVGQLYQHNDLVERMVGGMKTIDTEVISHLRKSLELLDKVIAKCEHEVRPIHSAIKG